ncbi:acetyl-CoA C-acyltransferase [Marinilongibacter aquaticus]|uniref:acetyl-CoA C-acyltransferase n=1 Tax=Marinilongibacter aquaticus TaxID=2975157 RepID=UPI0021BDA823|nr:acetyl-CoA C-acyltransferase [Marinilongibacter aquaticus]UBM57807.1 acetyl-CoA C-acyltransferase [Marinilongibacter aquaticus]
MNAYIIKGFRTAVGKASRGGLRFTRPDDLAAENIKYLLAQVPELDPARVDDVIVGNAVPEAEQGMQMARYISLLALGKQVPGITINRYCGSGLEAIAIASAKINAGMADCIIAGGTESMSMVPTMGWKTALNYKIAKEHPDYYLGMGLTAEQVAQDYKIGREEQDEFAFRSHQKALHAQENGLFEEEIVPIKVEETYFDQNSGKKKTKEYVVKKDEGPRADTSKEALAKLRPVFAANGSVTAGNSSQTSDGAAFVIVMSESMVKELKLEPVARLLSYAVAGVEPRIMGIGPVAAVPKALKQADLALKDIEQIELNEAFAAQSLAVIKELDLNPDIVNPNGGAIALGHALGSTGARLSVQLFNEMRRRKQKYGMVTACVGGGQGVAGIYELLK